MPFSLSALFAPLITALTPSFLTAVDIVLVMTVLLTGLWAYWSLVQRIIGFVRGLQLDRKIDRQIARREAYAARYASRTSRMSDVEYDLYREHHGQKNDTSRGRSSRSRRR